METLAEKIQKESEKMETVLKDDTHFKELKDFYEKIRKLGLNSPIGYSIPPLDTIGKRLYQKDVVDHLK
ncbi:hypothetical protein [Algoriphagus sp.]|uniref:hypothetical protein n=1 Tax=Algoriphagus sp. TaxID=1872435 RepID=UPI00391B4D7E